MSDFNDVLRESVPARCYCGKCERCLILGAEEREFYLIDPKGGEHLYIGTLDGARAEALERGYGADSVEEVQE